MTKSEFPVYLIIMEDSNNITNMRSQKGFTLVEVMIVAAVMGFLAAIALIGYSRAQEGAQIAICRGNQKAIYEAAVLYALNEPDSLENKGQKARLDALIDRGYIRKESIFECPSSTIEDYDDYVLVFDGDYITDVNCETRPEDHIWP